VVAISVGTVMVPVGSVWRLVGQHLSGDVAGADPLYDQIVWSIRTPRVLLAAVVGGCLAVSGVVLQVLVRNPLADPYVLGVSSGASFGAILAVTAAPSVLVTLGVTGSAFAGAVVTLVVVFVLAQQSGQLADARLILAGVAVSYLAMAGTTLVQLRADQAQVKGILFYLMGSVAGATWHDLGLPASVMVAATAWLGVQGRQLNALALGDDDAAALGIDVHRLRIGLLLVSSLLTATSVAVAGGIGFVGLMVPHAVRLVMGADHRRLLPVSAVTGSVFLVLVDLAARTVDRPNEYPVTVFTAAIGAPFFLYLLRTNAREHLG
jgi:iron complex transport system permease protein